MQSKEASMGQFNIFHNILIIKLNFDSNPSQTKIGGFEKESPIGEFVSKWKKTLEVEKIEPVDVSSGFGVIFSKKENDELVNKLNFIRNF